MVCTYLNIPAFYRTDIARTLVPSYPRTLVPSYSRTLVPSYPRTLVPSYTRTLVPSYPRTPGPCTLVPSYPRTFLGYSIGVSGTQYPLYPLYPLVHHRTPASSRIPAPSKLCTSPRTPDIHSYPGHPLARISVLPVLCCFVNNLHP